jgi:hypothetical protein
MLEYITKYKDLQIEYFELIVNITATKACIDRAVCAKILFNLYNQNHILKEMTKESNLTDAVQNKIAANIELIAAIKSIKKFI